METADVLKALLGLVVGAIGSYVGLYWKIKKELEAQYDKDLRMERVKAYTALWKVLQALAKYSRPEPVTASSLMKLSAALRQWYFEVGGIFMSTRTRDAYFALQDEIQRHLLRYQQHVDQSLEDNDFEAIRRAGSRLRTATTVDVGSRKEPLMIDEASA